MCAGASKSGARRDHRNTSKTSPNTFSAQPARPPRSLGAQFQHVLTRLRKSVSATVRLPEIPQNIQNQVCAELNEGKRWQKHMITLTLAHPISPYLTLTTRGNQRACSTVESKRQSDRLVFDVFSIYFPCVCIYSGDFCLQVIRMAPGTRHLPRDSLTSQ